MSNELPRVVQGDLPMVAGAGAKLLEVLLQEWEAELRRVHYPIDEATLAGISRDETQRIFSAAGLRAPAELVTWFGWRNGQPMDAPPIAGWFHAADAANSIHRRALGIPVGNDEGDWRPSWVRLGHTDPAISMDTADDAPAPLLRVTHFDTGPWSEGDFSDVRSLCTPVAFYIDALRTGRHRWGPATRTFHRDVRPPADRDIRWAYI